MLPSSHTTVRTEPYTAVQDHYDLAPTNVIIGVYPIASITLFERALCIPAVTAILHGSLLLFAQSLALSRLSPNAINLKTAIQAGQ